MDYQNPRSGKKMETDGLSLDRISTLPESVVDHILTLMPIRDALRTSILSKKWRYSWRTMPKLVFTDNMVKVHSKCGCGQLKKFKLVNAIFHVLLFHNGPTIVEFGCNFGKLHMVSECDQIISYLSTGKNVKELSFTFENDFYKLPVSFFSLQGLETIKLKRCVFEPPLTFDGFSSLKTVAFGSVKVSTQTLQWFLAKSPLIEHLFLVGDHEDVDFVAGGDKITFVDLLQCVPLVQTLGISDYYMKYLSAGGIPRRLPTLLLDLEYLFLSICITEQNEISSALCMIRSSPLLENITLWMYSKGKLPVQKHSTNFLDPDDYSDLELDNLETLKIEMTHTSDFVIDFVELIMAKSPVLEMVQIKLYSSVSVDEELKMLKDLVLCSFPRASPSAKLTIVREET